MTIPYGWKRRMARPLTRWDYIKGGLIFAGPLILIVILILLLGCSARADGLPDAPVAKPRPTPHRFYDKWGKMELAAAFTVASADSAITCHNLANGGREMWQPSQSCAGNTAILLGGVVAQEGVAFIFHRLGWHTPERVVRFFTIEESLRAIRYTQRHGGI